MASAPSASTVFDMLATAPRTDVITDTGTSNIPTHSNGTGWYFNGSYAWGFASQGDSIFRNALSTTATTSTSMARGRRPALLAHQW